jgi:hypothetical protein
MNGTTQTRGDEIREIAKAAKKKALPPPRRLGELLAPAMARVDRRARGEEKPIPLPWPVLADHFGGGLWPGVHYLTKGTGIGGTQLALQLAVHAGRAGFPCLYGALEMGDFDLGVRAIGNESGVPWSALYTGCAGDAYLARAREVVACLDGLPIHVEVTKPMAYSVADLVAAFEQVRALYPGEQPMLGVVDFLQLFGDEPNADHELRQRIANASYALREVSVRLNVAVLAISSIAREGLKRLPDMLTQAGLVWDEDDSARPVNRRMLDPDAIVGLGKESGEIEYSGDSVSVLARVGGTFDGHGCDVIFATAKGRATGAMWSPLHFTGYRYEECDDRGARVLEAWKAAEQKRERERAERKERTEQKRVDKLDADARLIAAYVVANPGCTVRAARAVAVANNYRRWSPAVARLGAAFVQTDDGCTINESQLRPEHRSECAP